MRVSLLSLVAAATVAAAPNVAFACGGCFIVQQSSSTVVSGHRMVVSLSTEQTVLWDQIQYNGDPTEFAWVLPIKPGARIEPSTSAFFDVLEATTQRQILSPPENCSNAKKGPVTGCAQALAADGDFSAPAPAVSVVHEGTVGPYETVTLHTSTEGALNQWLASHNYNVDPASQPVIDEYVAEGFDFIALRLQPGKGVRQMTPVRVVMPGGGISLPLRMVSIGTGASVPIILYVIGDGRWKPQNFPEARVETTLLAYDFDTKSSNYADLRTMALAQNGGKSWLTAYANQGTWLFDSGISNGPVTYETSNFLQAYAKAARDNGEAQGQCDLAIPDGLVGVVENPCPAGAPYDSPTCGTVQLGNVDIRYVACNGADDLGVALLGRAPGKTWLTRLEANLPHAALTDDLVLTAAELQTPVQRDLTATISEHADKACGTTVIFPKLVRPGKPPANSLPALLGGLLAATLAAFSARRIRPLRARS
jgi:hypothetical protein